MASLPYLIGDVHCNQLSHLGIVAVFENKPPKRIIGIVKSGAIEVAVGIFGEDAEMSKPMPIAVFATSSMTRYTCRKLTYWMPQNMTRI